MIVINLLPWRALKREKDKQQWIKSLFYLLLVTVLLVLALNRYFVWNIEKQIARAERLNVEMNLFNQRIKVNNQLRIVRQALLKKMRLIQRLQMIRIVRVRLFDELVKVIPAGAYLTRIALMEDNVLLTGYARSNRDISHLLRHSEQNQWIQKSELGEIKKSEPRQDDFPLAFVVHAVTG